MHKVKFNARTEYEYLNNFKVLTGSSTPPPRLPPTVPRP